tara:strand:- start:745 stop:1002 length:258 start_codon:yes stop_codon:yes gene_type:complete
MKNFKEFIEEVDSADEKSTENRSEIARKRFETQKIKTKSEIESTREKVKDSGKRSTSMFNKHQSVKLNKSQGQLPTFNRKKMENN